MTKSIANTNPAMSGELIFIDRTTIPINIVEHIESVAVKLE